MTVKRRGWIDWRDERGQLGGIEALPFGVLIFVVGSLLVANAWAVIDAKIAVTSASREAARSYVEGSDELSGAAAARVAAADAMAGHGRDPERTTLRIEHLDGRGFERCARVRVEVSHPVPAVSLPWIGGYGEGFTARSVHTELIDPFRDGLTGGGC